MSVSPGRRGIRVDGLSLIGKESGWRATALGLILVLRKKNPSLMRGVGLPSLVLLPRHVKWQMLGGGHSNAAQVDGVV